MSPARKRPVCHTCNTPMAGHKRPQGVPICPTGTPSPPPKSLPSPPASPSPLRDPRFMIPPSGQYHYINPNFVEPPVAPRPPIERLDTPMTWVSTEPADDLPLVKHEIDFGLPRAPSTSSQAPSLVRTFTQVLSNSIPLASIFRTPKEDITTVTREAQKQGLFTGLMHHPRAEQVKEEPSPTLSGIKPQSSWWVVLGGDAGAVSHLMDLHVRDTTGALDYGQRNERVGSYPQESLERSGVPMITVIFCCMLSAYGMWFLLCTM